MIQSMSGNSRKYQSNQALPTTIRVMGKPAFLMKCLQAPAISESARCGNVDGDAVGIGELELAVLALGQELEPDLAFGTARLG